MRSHLLLSASVLILAACSEPGVGPNTPLANAPTVQLTQIGGDPASADLCGGLSPCDAYDYRDDGSIGAEGMCFLPPTVDNHLSDPACSAPNTPGLSGIFQLAWCQVLYTDPTGATPPTIVPGSCQDPEDWVDLVEENGHYSASVRWRRNEADDGDIFRVYVVRGAQAFAHRDLIIDPNLTTPADDYVHAIGYGNEPIKLVITDDFSCIKYDTQGGTPENAATCLISGAESVSFETSQVITTFNFPDGNPTFLADFEVSECLSLGFDVDAAGTISGNALVDTPLADCKISLSSEELAMLDVPAQIQVTVKDPRWSDVEADDAPFQHARLNVLQYDELGLGALPPSTDPGWFGAATSSSAALRLLDWGLDKLASLVLPRELYAFRGAGWDFTRMSDFQVSVQGIMDASEFGAPCSTGEPYCVDLGTYSGDSPVVPVSVRVSAPTALGPAVYPDDHFPVPDTRLHFFPEDGDAIACPTGSAQDPITGRGCVEPGEMNDLSTDPPSTWGHVVVITGPDGIGSVDWTLGGGNSTLHVVACGVARPGDTEADPPSEPGSDHVWGTLSQSGCVDRSASITSGTGYDNGPADGFTPFEPVDIENEVAVYGLPIEVRAETCPTINVDGVKSDAFGVAEWEACAEKTIFTAPQKGPKVEDNATLYTYSDGEALYVGVEVQSNDLGNKIFLSMVESFTTSGEGIEAAGDELLVLDFGGETTPVDWHLTQQCVDNSSSSLCGDPDAAADGAFAADAAALEGGAGSGTVFYEFVRPLRSPNAADGPGKEDLGVTGGSMGLKVTVTQGQGGGKGGFVYPDPQTSAAEYHVFTIE
ncbi:MAG: hypothetical protein PVH96_09745 [Gemmatimonadota bacterium]|jgi:hypothetical protein